MEGLHVVAPGYGGLGDGSPPVGSRGKAPIGGLGDEVSSPEAETNVKLAYNF